MKILLIHYRYFIEGGPERYLFNIKEILEKNGHEVIPFSIQYSENVETEYKKYFVKPSIKSFHVSKAKVSIFRKIKFCINYLYNSEAKRKLKKLIIDTKPDLAYVLVYSGKLSYTIFEACREMNIPVVHRISEFSRYCICCNFFRNGKICTECIQNKKACLKYNCYQNSWIKTRLLYLAEENERRSGVRDYISNIICPSRFTQNLFIQNPVFNNAEIHHVPTFFNFKNELQISMNEVFKRKEINQICYIGRICEEKGIDVLIDAWKILESKGCATKLILTGFFDNEYCSNIKNKILELQLKNIVCYDFLSKEETFNIIENSLISLVPSIWFDNMPNSFIESQAYSVPVIATNIGSLSELIEEGKNGYLFEINDEKSLVLKIEKILMMSNEEYYSLAKNSYSFIKDYCSVDKHYNSLINIFEKAIKV